MVVSESAIERLDKLSSSSSSSSSRASSSSSVGAQLEAVTWKVMFKGTHQCLRVRIRTLCWYYYAHQAAMISLEVFTEVVTVAVQPE